MIIRWFSIPFEEDGIPNTKLSAPLQKVGDIVSRVKRLRFCIFPTFGRNQRGMSYRTLICDSVYGNFLRETALEGKALKLCLETKALISQVCTARGLTEDESTLSLHIIYGNILFIISVKDTFSVTLTLLSIFGVSLGSALD